jgi:glycosyltransferase involved in cell wall biosynthesis
MDRGLISAGCETGETGLRKLLVIVQLPPPVHGAAVVNAMVVSSSEIRKHFEVSVVPINVSDSLSNLRKFSVVKILKSFVVLSKIMRRMVFDRPQVCYLTMAPYGYAFYRDCMFIALFRLFQIPYVIHLHGRGMAKSHKSAGSVLLAKFALRKAIVVHLSPLLMGDIAPFVKAANVRFVANGVVDPYCGQSIEKPHVKVVSILFLSTMLESKGPLVLLEALAILKNERLLFKATFAGPWRGSLMAEDFDRYVEEAGLKGCVEHVGSVYGDAKNLLFRSSDILAFPTHYENEAFPLVVLEGMAAGLVPVTSNIAALPDIVGDAGFVVPPQNPIALARALGKLLRNAELLNVLQIRSRARYQMKFTSEQFERSLAIVLDEAGVEKTVVSSKRP